MRQKKTGPKLRSGLVESGKYHSSWTCTEEAGWKAKRESKNLRAAGGSGEEDLEHVEVSELHLRDDDLGRVD